MTPELKQALMVIRNECLTHAGGTCDGCPLYDMGEGCKLFESSPDQWAIGLWAVEDENGRG